MNISNQYEIRRGVDVAYRRLKEYGYPVFGEMLAFFSETISGLRINSAVQMHKKKWPIRSTSNVQSTPMMMIFVRTNARTVAQCDSLQGLITHIFPFKMVWVCT